MSIAKRTAAVIVLLLIAACGASPTAPTPSPSPTPNPRSIALGSTMPASGSTLSIGACGRGACTKALAYSFVVRFDVAIQEPVFRVALTTADGVECLAAFQTDLVPLRAGDPHGFAGDTLLFSTTPPQSPNPEDSNCQPPFTTTRIETELHDGDLARPVLLAQDFDVTYQWVK